MNKPNVERSILACVSYFNLFQHPLMAEEIYSFLNTKFGLIDLEIQLAKLVQNRQLFLNDGYYSLEDNMQFVSDRIANEKRADDKVNDAIKYGNLIRKFPFISGVFISGSLSKHVMKEDDDIDFFIIASANRIWIAKLFLKLYKVVFLKNSYEYFCLNYFISESNIEIQEKNTYTATELATLIPIGCDELHKKLHDANPWFSDYLPNFSYEKSKAYETGTVKSPMITKLLESFLSGRVGNFLDTKAMKLHQKWNDRKYAHLKETKDYELMMRSTKEQIKVHPPNNQGKTLKSYQSKISKLGA